MSQRPLAPTNLFYSWSDPTPELGFPEPNTGDIYFNVSSNQQRVYYNDQWHDAGVGASHSVLSDLDEDDHPQYYNAERGDARYVQNIKMVVQNSPPPPGAPAGGPGTLWIEY